MDKTYKIKENLKIDEKIYEDTLKNNMKLLYLPKRETDEFYVVIGVDYGSIDNYFKDKDGKEIRVTDGLAHYLEHKMFEQEKGENALNVLSSLGLNANAYTTFDHTAYLFSGTSKFYEGLDCLMDYIQSPYFTDENVEKERGIISQEINMYKDDPTEKLQENFLMGLFGKENPLTVNIAGSVESIQKIDKELLYYIYNRFYKVSNMTMCVVGDFDYEELKLEIEKRIKTKADTENFEKAYNGISDKIYCSEKTEKANINGNMLLVGYKDITTSYDRLTKEIATQIILNSVIGKCSETYQELYTDNLVMVEPESDYMSYKCGSYVEIFSNSENPQKAAKVIAEALENKKIKKEDFERSKKRIYGEFISGFNDYDYIGNEIMKRKMRGMDILEIPESIMNIDYETVLEIQNEIFKIDNRVISIVESFTNKE